MKYSYGLKKECVRLYRLGEWADTSEGIGDKQFRDMIMIWHRLEDFHGLEVPKHNSSRAWTADEKFEFISKAIVGEAVRSVAIKAGISRGHRRGRADHGFCSPAMKF